MSAARGRRQDEPEASGIQDGAFVHLYMGDEEFLRERAARELAERLAPEDNRDYNFESFSGPDLDLDRVIAACEMLPMLSPRRVVFVRHLDLKATAAHAGFARYLESPNPTTALILTAGKSAPAAKDEGSKTGKSKGTITVTELLRRIPSQAQFGALRSEQAVDFARSAARKRSFEIALDAAQALVELCGTQASRLDDEVEKAVLYARGRNRIELADIEVLARRTRAHTVFELTDAVASGNRTAVLRELDALFADGMEAVALVGMIAWQLRRTLRGASLVETGLAPSEVARTVGVHWKLADRFVATCRQLGTRNSAAAIQALRRADRSIKSSPEDNRRMLERTLVELLPAAKAVTGGRRGVRS